MRKTEKRFDMPVGGDLHDPLALSQLDRVALGLVSAALLLAPLCAGGFSTAPDAALQGPPDGLLAWLQTVGTALVVGLIALALTVAIWREWKRPVAIGAAPFLAGATLLMATWAGLSLIRSPALYMGLDALMVLLASLSGATLAARLCRNRNGLATLLIVLICGGTLAAMLGVQEYLSYWKQGAPEHRTAGAFINPDFLAGYLLLTIPVTMAAVASVTERLPRLALGFALALQSACLLFTASRAGLAALGVEALIWIALSAWSGAARGRWPRLGGALALVALGALLASAPTRARLSIPAPGGAQAAQKPATADAAAAATGPVTQSRSLLFRRYTWEGTLGMAKANPILGTGLGSFEIAYPRYAITAYTAHAHNSLLQWTAETGLPGAILLLTAFAAATAFAVNVLRLRRTAIQEPGLSADDRHAGLFDEPALLLAGLLAALAGSGIKTFIDSDWYIVATVLTLAVLTALLVGLARSLAPLATQTPLPLSRGMLAAGLAAMLLMLGRAAETGSSHMEMDRAAAALQDRRGQEALDAIRSASAADPFDPELHLDLATLYQGMGQSAEQQSALLAALRVAPIAKVYYRLAQFYAGSGDSTRAIEAYRQALVLDPDNLQTLRHLAETLDRSGRTDEAVTHYHTMTDLEASPYGTVRAIADEMIETEYAYAHAGLAAIAARQRKWSEAALQYRRADAVMRAYWARRNWLVYAAMTPQKRETLAKLYRDTLNGWEEALRSAGAAPGEIAAVQEEQRQIAADVEDDARKEQEATNGAGH